MKTLSLFLVLLTAAPWAYAQNTNAAPGTNNPAGTNVSAPPSFPAFPSAPVTNNTQPSATNAAPAQTRTLPPRTTRGAVPAPGVPNAPAVPPQSPVSAPAPVPAPTAAPVADPAEYSLDVENGMPLIQLLQYYAKLVDRTILRSPAVVPTTIVSFKTQNPLTRSEMTTALETLLAMNGVTVVPIGDKFIKVVPEANAGTSGAEFSTVDPDQLPVSGQFVTRIIQLKYIPLQDAVSAIQPFAKAPQSIVPIPASNTIVLRDYSENVKRMLEVLERIDTIVPLEVKPAVIPIKYALASDIAQVLSELSGGSSVTSVGRSTRSGLTGTTGTGFQTGTTQPGATGQTTQPGGTFGSGSTAARNSFQQNLQRIVSRAATGSTDFQILGQAKIIADERTNSLLIFANDQDMVMIKDIISRLDIVLAQVLIEAIIMEVNLTDSKNVGVSYLQRPGTAGNVAGVGGLNNLPSGGNFINPRTGIIDGVSNAVSSVGIQNLPGGFSYFANFGGDFDVALLASATDSRVNVLSRPRVQTSHAEPARMFIGNTVPYITGSTFGDFGGISSRSTYQEKSVGITLEVLPLINSDGLVVMDIAQEIEQLGPATEIDGNDVPTTTRRSAAAKVAVRDRDTIILGGFISTSRTKTKSGIPLLKDIPFLGAAFRSSSDSDQRIELMVLMRPTVLPTPEAAALAATQEREQLPGVKQGEMEIREYERKRQEKIEEEMRKKMGIKVRQD